MRINTSRPTDVVFVGLDYHTAFVQVCVLDRDGNVLHNGTCPNDWQRIRRMAEKFGTRVRAAVEACTGAADLAEELVGRAGWSVDLAHPGYVARMKQNPDKTDYSDAWYVASKWGSPALVVMLYLPPRDGD